MMTKLFAFPQSTGGTQMTTGGGTTGRTPRPSSSRQWQGTSPRSTQVTFCVGNGKFNHAMRKLSDG